MTQLLDVVLHQGPEQYRCWVMNLVESGIIQKGLHVSLYSTAPKARSVLLLIKEFTLFHFKYAVIYSILHYSHSWKHPTGKLLLLFFFFFVYKQPLNNGQVRKRNILKCSNLRWLSSVHIQDSTILIYECLSRYSNFLTYFEHLNSTKIKYSLHNQKGTLCSLCNSESPLNSLPQVKFLLKRKPGDSCIASLHYFYLTANTINHCIKTVQHYT